MDTFDILGHWRGGANQDAANEAIRTGEPVKLGFLEKLYGGKTEDAQNIVNREQQKALNNKYAGQFAQLGLTGADWGQTEQQVLAKIGTRRQEREAGQVEKRKQERLEQRGYESDREDTRLSNQMAMTREENSANREFQRAENQASRDFQGDQFAHTASESAKDRALSRDLTNSSNDLAMQMKFMESDLADKRMDYDRETRSMDKRDRMIAQLMSGLGQLGGAFAL